MQLFITYNICLLYTSKFNITCQKDFEELPEDLMDKHVSKNTQFKTWQEMLDFATDKYIISKQK